MTDRLTLMHHMEDLLKVLREYAAKGHDKESLLDIAEGYVRGTREQFDLDTNGGAYGPGD